MIVSINYGDNNNSISGEKAKGQTLIANGDSSLYFIYGDVDKLFGGSKGGNDIIYGKSSNNSDMLEAANYLFGDGRLLSGSTGGNDEIFGGDNIIANNILGDADSMVGSRGGNDRLTGGSNVASSVMVGDANIISNATDPLGQIILSRGGNDVLIAGADNFANTMVGDCQYMYGGIGGNDLLIGSDSGEMSVLVGDATVAFGNVTCGNDRLFSGAASELIWGDCRFIYTSSSIEYGHDTFVFKENNGSDMIFDFRHGEDKIELSGMAGINNFSSLQIDSVSGDSIITLGTGDSITVTGIRELQAEDFIFS